MDAVAKGEPIRCDGIEIVPLARRVQHEFQLGAVIFTSWTLEPLGVQVIGDGEMYALDLDGNRSDWLLQY